VITSTTNQGGVGSENSKH